VYIRAFVRSCSQPVRLPCLLTEDTFAEIFGIIVKTDFRYDGGENFAWDTITEIAGNSKDPEALAYAIELRRYYTLERPTGNGKA
jgi:L-proline cis-4-hydroxylase